MGSLLIVGGFVTMFASGGLPTVGKLTPAPLSLQVMVQASFTPPQPLNVRPPWPHRPPFMPPPQRPRYGGSDKLRNTVVGAVGGLLAGALIGYAVTRDCTCDSPGFEGTLRGVPIGGAAGAVVGFLMSK